MIVQYDETLILTLRLTCKWLRDVVMSMTDSPIPESMPFPSVYVESGTKEVCWMLMRGDVVGLLKYTLNMCTDGPKGFAALTKLSSVLVQDEDFVITARVSYLSILWIDQIVHLKSASAHGDGMFEYYCAIWCAATEVDEPRALSLIPDDQLRSVISGDDLVYECGSVRVYRRLLDTVWTNLDRDAVATEVDMIEYCGHVLTSDDDGERVKLSALGRELMLNELQARYLEHYHEHINSLTM